MHLPTILTTLTPGLATLASAAALDTTTSVPTGFQSPGPSNTCSASSVSSASYSIAANDGSANKPQTIEEYIKATEAKNAAKNTDINNSKSGLDAAKDPTHVNGMTAYEVSMCCLSGCDFCSIKICGPGQFCDTMPFYSCCATIILWDTKKNEVMDAFTTEGKVVNFIFGDPL